MKNPLACVGRAGLGCATPAALYVHLAGSTYAAVFAATYASAPPVFLPILLFQPVMHPVRCGKNANVNSGLKAPPLPTDPR